MDSRHWQRVKDVFVAVVDTPAAHREALLEELCAGDATLRREVASLLDAHDAPGQLLPTDGLGIAAKCGSADGALPAQSYGAYRVIREIDRGGMGTVYLAEHADECHEQVAVKVVRCGPAAQELRRRLGRERQILATLHHPHIARLLDEGVTVDGDPFLVMEYVDGVRIDEYCAGAGLAERERLELFLRVCSAVAYAHEFGVLHRDLKPSNILVTGAGVPKLLDFGIARSIAADSADTVTEHPAFTPYYAAPEQVRGETPLTAAVDVYSLGVLLGVLLGVSTTTRPQAGRTEATREIRQIIEMACRTAPEDRYGSVRELCADIERYLEGRPVEAGAKATYAALATLVEHRGTAVVGAMLAVAMLLTGVVAMKWSTSAPGGTARVMSSTVDHPLATLRSMAVLPFRLIGETSDTSPPTADALGSSTALRVGMADAIVSRLSQVRHLAVRPTSATVQYVDRDDDVVSVGRALGVDGVLEGTLLRVGNELYVTLQLVDVREGHVLWADALTSDMATVLQGPGSLASRVGQLLALNLSVSSEAAKLRPSTNLDAQDAYLQGSLALATATRQVENIVRAREAFERAIRLDPEFGQAHAGLAGAYTLAGSLTLLAPHEAYPRAERAARRALDIEPDNFAAHVALAEIEADYRWNWTAAEAFNRRALELAPNSAVAHHSYAEFLARQGRFSEAAMHSDLAIGFDPTRSNYLAVRALHLYLEHRFPEALTYAHKAVERDAATYLAYLYLAVTHAAMGDYGAGFGAARQAAALTGGAIPDTFVLGVNYALSNNRRNAEDVLRRLHEWSRTRYVDPFHFVTLHAYLGQRDLAFEYLERSFEERSYWMTTLKVHPMVNPLRGDPRFSEMLERMRLD